jgi:hypothetical protein
MLQKLPMGELMRLAHSARLRRIPAETVTFVVDTNPNYTNVCATRCSFCAFHRPVGAADAYTLTPQELAGKVKAAQALGATTVLLQGGHHPGIRLADWIAYIRAIRDSSPGIHIHPFSPAEYVFLAKQEKLRTCWNGLRGGIGFLRAVGPDPDRCGPMLIAQSPRGRMARVCAAMRSGSDDRHDDVRAYRNRRGHRGSSFGPPPAAG